MSVEAPPRPDETELLETLLDVDATPTRARPTPVSPGATNRPPPPPGRRAARPDRPGNVGSVVASAHTARLLGAEDPRFAQRRRDVTVQLLRSRTMPYAVTVIVGVLIVATLWSPMLRIRSIRVFGAVGRAEHDVLRASGLSNGTPLVTISVGDIRRRIERLPAVEAARVTRTWPSHVTIQVVLREPAARVPFTSGGLVGSVALVDGSGRVVDVVESSDANAGSDADHLPELQGAASIEPGGHVDRQRADEAAVAAALGRDIRPRVRTLGTDATVIVGVVSLPTGGQTVRIYFGAATDLAAKASALRSLLADPSTASLAAIDLSVPDAPILTPLAQGASQARTRARSSIVAR